MAVIAVAGLIGSGKDTVAEYLVNEHGFKRESFAGSLKNATAAIFGWQRDLLEGHTAESRQWRETVDTWWATRLGIPNLTPRWVLQYIGTDVLRQHFHDDIWVAGIEYKLQKSKENIVISDCRFPNEITALRRINAQIIRVKRGADPTWFEVAKQAMAKGDTSIMQRQFPAVHSSEYSWANTDFDQVLFNDGSLKELYTSVDILAKRTLHSGKPTPVLEVQFL
ncbi:hypothetical protein UFOVP116_25 [uncultured Caudovirales phage]|uniref:Deoxynucleoside monophosphate kinase n=1 Tax=uncultured Caudovirales phage TaxID=2100421 RepID=A0A6J5L7Q1_9CAUD|nr:hypothetical protein UFOVP116_25 [uncultured Caudovirales phage]